MTEPRLLPTLRPFQEAIDFQRERVPMLREAFDDMSNEAKLRAFTIAGLTRRSLVAEAYQLAYAAMQEGVTKSEFQDRLGEVLDKQEGLFLSPKRLDLIAANNAAVSYSSGRHTQLTEISDLRPYWMYPPEPNDANTSAICLKLQGFIARFDDAVWQRIFPPNHHKERHINVRSLTEEEAKKRGAIYESAGAKQYPVIDGQELLPDPGFDYSPGLLSADDRALAEAAKKAGTPLPAKRPDDYKLDSFAREIANAKLPAAPQLGAALNPARLSDDAQYEEAWKGFRELVGLARVDAAGDGVVITRATFDELVGIADGSADALLAKHDAPRFFPLIAPAIADPQEIWMAPFVREDGRVSWVRRYFAAFEGESGAITVLAEQSAKAWLHGIEVNPAAQRVEQLRTGFLIYRRKGGNA